MSAKICCVPNCNKSRADDTILHTFPNPIKKIERFKLWTNAIGGEILLLDDQTVFECRRVCHSHFEPQYYTRSKRLSPAAVPTLHLQVRDHLVDHDYGLQKIPDDSVKSTDNIGIDGDNTCTSPSLSVEDNMEVDPCENVSMEEKLTDELDVPLCAICLRANRSLKAIEEMASFYNELSHNKLTEDMLVYCSECETTLKKCYNFKRKCTEASTLLKCWVENAGMDRPPKTHLYEELGPPPLDIWKRDNIGIYYFKEPDVTKTNEKFEFNIAKSGSGEINSMIMVTNTDKTDIIEKSMDSDSEVNTTIKSKISDDAASIDPLGNTSIDNTKSVDANPSIIDGNFKQEIDISSDFVTEYKPTVPKSILERIQLINSESKHQVKLVMMQKSDKNIHECNKIDKGINLLIDKCIGDSQSRENKNLSTCNTINNKNDSISRETQTNETNALMFPNENADDGNIVTYEIMRENNVIVKEVLKISPTARSNENKCRNYEKFKELVELAKVDATFDNQECQDFVSIEANDNIDAQKDLQDLSTQINENDTCEEIIVKGEVNNDMNPDDDRNEEDALYCSDSFINDDLPIPYKNEQKASLKHRLNNIFKKYTETLMTTEGYIVNKHIILCLFENMSDEDLWKLHKVTIGVRSNARLQQLVNVLAALQQKYETLYTDKFDVVYLDTEEEVRREFENRQTYPQYLEFRYKCKMCFTAFKYKNELENHMNLHSSNHGDAECDICHIRKNSEHKLKVHRQTHSVVFKCKLCPMVTNLKNNMMVHVGQHEGRVFVCEVCGYTFKTERIYKIHRRRHWDNICEFCGVCFPTRLLLDKHRTRSHMGMDVTQSAHKTRCEQCLAVFASRAVCNKHRARAHTNKGFPRFCFYQDGSVRRRIRRKKKSVLDQALNLDQTPNAPVQVLSNYDVDRMVEDSGQILFTVKCTSQDSAQELVWGENLLDTSVQTTYIAGQTAIQNQTESFDQTQNNVNQTYDIFYHDDMVEQTVEIVDQSHNEHNIDQIPLVDGSFQDGVDGIAKRVKKPQHSQESQTYLKHKFSKKRSHKLQQEVPKKRAQIEMCARRNTDFTSYLDQAMVQYNALNDMPELD